MTYQDLLNRLKAISPEEYEFEARVLVECYTEHKISYYISDPARNIDSQVLEVALKKREERVPLQYIIGEWDFYRQTYFVNESCLIPRSDTEILVEKAIQLLPRNSHFADLCTGSGCIAISTLCERPDTSAIMVDKFDNTLAIANRNAERNGVSNKALPMLFDVLNESSQLDGMSFDAILSNPPYIRPDVIETLTPEVKKEPYAALYGGEDGLIFYRTIVAQYSKYLKKDGFFLFEIGYDQADDLRAIADQNAFNCEIFKDYGANDRVAYLTRK